jgi:hypothetical protein
MKRFGASDKSMGPMDESQVFWMRLHLLTVIVKAALKGYPIGDFRQAAAIETASQIRRQIIQMEIPFLKSSTASHLFKQRVKLLCIMATAIVSESYPLGIHRQEAVLDNLQSIVESAFSQKQEQFIYDILKVA